MIPSCKDSYNRNRGKVSTVTMIMRLLAVFIFGAVCAFSQPVGAGHRAEPGYTLPCLPQPGARSSNFLRFLINLQISENFQQREVPPHVNRCSSAANRCAAVVYLLWIKCSAEAMKSSNTFCLCARERKRQWERELPRTARMQLTCFRRRA